MDSSASANLQSVERAFEVVEALHELGASGVTELADELDMPKSTVHRYLSTLHAGNYVVRRDGQYQVGFKFLDIGARKRQRVPEYRFVEPKLRQLADETGERVQFIVEEHGRGVIVYWEAGDQAVSLGSRSGKRIPLHTAAAGKAILSQLPEESVHEILDRRELTPETPHSITDRDELLEHLELIRERGYSYNKEEHTEGLWSVGVPIADSDDGVLGSISISGPTHRLVGERVEREIPDLLLGTANEIELNITYG